MAIRYVLHALETIHAPGAKAGHVVHSLNIPDACKSCMADENKMKALYLDKVASRYGACILYCGCQVATLGQGLKRAARGVVELAHLRPHAQASSTCQMALALTSS